MTRRTLLAALMSFLLFAVVYMVNIVSGYYPDVSTGSAFTAIRIWRIDVPLLSCLTAGLFGSYFSRLLYIQMYSRKFCFDELVWTRHLCVIFVRGAIGVCGAAVLYFVLRSGIISGIITTSLVPKFKYLAVDSELYMSNEDLALLVIWGFFAGFSERLVPSILATTESRLVTTESKNDETAKRPLRRSAVGGDGAKLVFSNSQVAARFGFDARAPVRHPPYVDDDCVRSASRPALASCWEEGDPENGSRALSLKAALAGEIMGANEVGVKRAEARPSLRSQFRIGRRRTPVSRRAMWRNNRLRPGHGGANEARWRRRTPVSRRASARWPSALVKAMEQPPRHARRQNPSAQ